MTATLRRQLPYALMLSPALVIFAIFFILPVFRTVQMSLTNQNNFSAFSQFVGMDNYVRALGDSSLLTGVTNSVWYAVATVVLQNLIALPIAVLLNSRIPFRNGFRAIFFTPAVMSLLVVGYLWGFLLSSDSYGLINRGLAQVGLPPVNWLGDASTAMWSIIATQVWQWFGYAMVIYLANLQAISPELYEAARIDGANGWQAFWHITLPGLLPAIQINVVTGLIAGLKVFDIVFAMTSGGPGGATDTALTLMYRTFSQGNSGYAASFGVLFLLVTLVVAALLLGFFRKMEARLR